MDLDCDSGEGIMKSDEEMGRDKPSGAGSNHNHYTSKYELLLLCDLVIILRVGEGVLEIAIIWEESPMPLTFRRVIGIGIALNAN